MMQMGRGGDAYGEGVSKDLFWVYMVSVEESWEKHVHCAVCILHRD